MVPPTYYGPEAIDAWYLMGGQIDWGALEHVVEILGVHDPELLVHGLIEVRQYFARQRAAEEEMRKRRK